MGGCCAIRPGLGDSVSLYEKVNSIKEEKTMVNSRERNSSTIVGENKSKQSELTPEKEKPTINRSLIVPFIKEELNVHHKVIERPGLIRADNLERWTNDDIESAFDEIGKELGHLAVHLHKVQDMESDAWSEITHESSLFMLDVEGNYNDKQNDKLQNDMPEASSEGQIPCDIFDNEENLNSIQQRLMVKRPSLIRPDNLEMWSDARLDSEQMEMRMIYKRLSRTLQSPPLAETSNKGSRPVVDDEFEEDVTTDLEDTSGSSTASVFYEKTAKVPRNGELNVRSILGERVSLYEQLDDSIKEEKTRVNSRKRNSSTTVGENKSEKSERSEVKPEKEKPTINKSISVPFLKEKLNVHHKLIERPGLIRADNLERWTNDDMESAFDEMGKELDHLVVHFHKAQDMESDA